MNKILFTAVFLAVCSCGSHRRHEQETKPIDKLEMLREKHDLYLRLSTEQVDEHGWLKDFSCDGLLFNSLFAISGGKPDIMLGRGEPAIWYRSWQHDCFPGHSRSSISRDMFAGLFLWIWTEKRKDLIEEIIDHGESNTNSVGGWVMGEGDPFTTNIRAAGQTLAYEMRYQWGGADHAKRYLPIPHFDVKGFEAHLQVLDILLVGLLRGLSKTDLKRLQWHVENEPRNALFQAVLHKFSDGDQSAAIESLLDTSLFPEKRLPSSAERCEPYLWQRDERTGSGSLNPDWLPCTGRNRIFGGVDFLFASTIVLNKI